MKRTFFICLLLALLIALLPAAAYAAGPGAFGANYQDADNDGICDNAADNNCAYTDTDMDGVCDNLGRAQGCGRKAGGYGFTDENNDGVCDYRGAAARGCGRGCGARFANMN